MPMYRLLEVDISTNGGEKVIMESEDLEYLKSIAEKTYLYWDESFISNIRITADGLPHYQNFGCEFNEETLEWHCPPHAVIELV
jgi:hypothetical protein